MNKSHGARVGQKKREKVPVGKHEEDEKIGEMDREMKKWRERKGERK